VARPRQFDEEKIIAAVRDLFWRQGYAATSLDDLMQVTGLGKGSIYGAFGDKRNLFLAVLVALQGPLIMMSQNRQAAKDRLRSETDFRVNLKNEVGIEHILREISKLKLELGKKPHE